MTGPILKSIILHIILIAIIFVIHNSMYSFNRMIYKQNVKLLQQSIRVDMVALPKLTLKELRQQNVLAEPIKPQEVIQKVNEKKDDKIELQQEHAKREEQNEKLKAMAKAIEELRKKHPKNKKENRPVIDDLDRLIISGNKLSKGLKLEKNGDQKESNEMPSELEAYSLMIAIKVKAYWRLPTHLLRDKKLKCRVQLFISHQGDLLKTQILESSENEEYDQKAIQTIKEASAFPRPSKNIVDIVRNGSIALGFPL